MKALRRTGDRSRLLVAAGVLALTVAGCREEPASQRIDVPDPTPIELVPQPMALPYAEAAPVNWTPPEAGYRFAERAYGLEEAFHDAPPDYAFDYGGVEPWGWETADEWAMYAEPWETGYRYYYYEPGAAYPYFVRDGLYGYGFDPSGALVALIGADGAYLPRERFLDAAPVAGRFWLHGRDLRNAAAQARRRPVREETWAARAPQVRRVSEPWMAAARNDRDWRAWRERSGRGEQKRFAQEQRRRTEAAQAWRRETRQLAAQQAPQAAAGASLPEVQARRDMALAQREHLRAQRDQARAQTRAAGVRREAQADKRVARQEAQAVREQASQQANAAWAQAQAQAQDRARQAREVPQQRSVEARRQAQGRARDQAQQAQAQARQSREQARAAQDHARQAADQARSQAKAAQGDRPGRSRPPTAERGEAGGADRGKQAGAGRDRGPKADRGGRNRD